MVGRRQAGEGVLSDLTRRRFVLAVLNLASPASGGTWIVPVWMPWRFDVSIW